MKIAIGTTNPIKIEAIKSAIYKVFPNQEHIFIPLEVQSGVSDQPMSDKETILGARTRARSALNLTTSDFGVGLEGGLAEIENKLYLSSWVCVVDRNNNEGLGSAVRLELPDQIVDEIHKGKKELGEIMDENFHVHNLKQKQGAFGVFTNNLITRSGAFESACICALAKFQNPEYYK
jgi:inosine/xanthosine triphosphatase